MDTLSKRIEEVLESYRRPVKVVGIEEAPQVWRVKVHPRHYIQANGGRGVRTRITHLRSLSADLAAELGVPSVSVSPGEDGLFLEIAKGDPLTVLAREVKVERGKYRVPLVLGRSTKGDPMVVDLADAGTPQVLVAGTTGSGKSMLLHSCVLGLTKYTYPERVRIVLVDTHSSGDTFHTGSIAQGDGLGIWKVSPHVEQVVTSSGDALLALQAALNLIDRRYASGTRWVTRWVFVIDELADVLLCKTYGEEVHRVLVEILASGRKAGVHVVAATQRPSADITKGILKANFPVRVSMAVASKVDSRVALGENGAELLAGKGDGLLKVGMRVVRFQGGLVTDEDVEAVREWGRLWRSKHGGSVKRLKRGSPPSASQTMQELLERMRELAGMAERRVSR